MNALTAIQLIQALDALVTVAANVGINMQKYHAMRANGPLTAAQLRELADELDRNIGKL